jgi:hypothetical protein
MRVNRLNWAAPRGTLTDRRYLRGFPIAAMYYEP